MIVHVPDSKCQGIGDENDKIIESPSARANLPDNLFKLGCKPSRIPAEMASLPRWVCWSYRRRGKALRKVPIHPLTGKTVSVNVPSDWSTFDVVVARLGKRKPPDGIGFVFDAKDGLVGIDLDKCRNPTTGTIAPWANDIISRIATYAEVSPSGTGVKLIARANIPESGRRRKNIEIYSHARFFAMTGHHLSDTPAIVAGSQHEVDSLYRLVTGGAGRMARETEWVGSMVQNSDEEIVHYLSQEGCQGVWMGDTSSYGSASEADMALCGAIARLVGPNAGRVEVIFNQSALAARGKWKDRLDYRTRTVKKAIEGLGFRTTLTESGALSNHFIQSIQERITQWRDKPANNGNFPAQTETAIASARQLAIEQGSEGTEYRRVFELVRRLRAFVEQPYFLQDAVQAYCEQCGRQFEEVWLRVLESWPKVESPDNWEWAAWMARIHPMRFRPENGKNYELVASLAYWLSLHNEQFPFGVEKVGEFLGMSAMMGSVVVRLLQDDKIIELAAKFDWKSKKAREFRFCGLPECGLPEPALASSSDMSQDVKLLAA
jgi:hypothetical protein